MSQRKAQIIYAPQRDQQPRGTKSIFLAGTTSPVDPPGADWRSTLTASLSDLPVTIFDPYRPDWDASWVEDESFAPFREQVTWELDMQDRADLVIVYFHPATKAAISLLELGLVARCGGGKAVVVCPEGYWKRGNVCIVCRRFGIDMVDDVCALRDVIVKKLQLGGGGEGGE
ncbi:hypothetical protein DL767_004369 [Monosporascus sp. MG133]|nr:hypothetical protein DL767_004369 [Monosporascus sp. MG133]